MELRGSNEASGVEKQLMEVWLCVGDLATYKEQAVRYNLAANKCLWRCTFDFSAKIHLLYLHFLGL